jgi:hypothetical protein
MKLNLKEIIEAWYHKFNPTDEEKELADKRFEICLKCPSKKETLKGQEWTIRCGECGCPLGAKTYSPKTYLHKDGSCPLGKWKEVEMESLMKSEKFNTIKQIKTII